MSSRSENIQAKSVSIVDDNGNVKAFLGSVQRDGKKNEPCLVMYDEQGFPRLEVGIGRSNPFVVMSLSDGSPSISIGSLHEEVKGILINDSEGSPCVLIQVENDGDSRIVFYQKDNGSLKIVKSYPE